jgi:hypothetical protein
VNTVDAALKYQKMQKEPFYNSTFFVNLKKQLKLSGYSMRLNKDAVLTIRSPQRHPYDILFPYFDARHSTSTYRSKADRYQRAIDLSIIETHLRHCESLRREELKNGLSVASTD